MTPMLTDLMLIVEDDARALAIMRGVAVRMGCDFIEAHSIDELSTILTMRQPTIALLAVDRIQNDIFGVLRTLAQHSARPAILLVGDGDPRVLASIGRSAEAYGLLVISTQSRPLDEGDLEQLLTPHVSAPATISREELAQALDQHEFILRYQPKVKIQTNLFEIEGVEAFVRWDHPRRGHLQPRHFLRSIDEHGLSSHLTDYVITEAVQQGAIWQANGRSLIVTVNLSQALVTDREFPDRLALLLREYDLSPSRISLDITETAINSDRQFILEVFTRLRILGIGLSWDNFGTGLSSLTELYRMPFSEIKIDRALLMDVPVERDAEIVVRAIADLAHNLGMSVCAEGVENRETLDFVRSARFDTAQGHLICGAVLAHEIDRLMDSWPLPADDLQNAPANADDPNITRRLKRIKLSSSAVSKCLTR